jgi:hypothetical protein
VIDNLEQNIDYYLYLGGVNGEWAVKNYVQFTTLNARCDNIKLFVSKEPLSPSDWTQVLDSITSPSTKANPNHSCPYFIQTASFVDIGSTVERKILELFDLSRSDQFDYELFTRLLAELTDLAKDVFRNAFNLSSVQRLARSCCMIILTNSADTLTDMFNSLHEEVFSANQVNVETGSSLNHSLNPNKSFAANIDRKKTLNAEKGVLLQEDNQEISSLLISMVGRLLRYFGRVA